MKPSSLLAAAILLVGGRVTHAKLPKYVGSRARFWKHHQFHKTLVVDGVEQYKNIENCMHKGLTTHDRESLKEIPTNRTIGRRLADYEDEPFGNIYLVEVKNAMTPVMVKAVQTLSRCIRIYIPWLHEKRPMYQEYNLQEDPGLGGNSPTHLAPLIGIFLPEVVDDMTRTIRLAYDAAGWQAMTLRDELLGKTDHGSTRAYTHPAPEDLGFRASEHLSYDDFPNLDTHQDGTATAYTINYAFSDSDEYEGGYLYVIDSDDKRTYLKPDKYSCVVFLGGHYFHGVGRIKGGHREMFSNEMWFNPDLPFGSNLWTSTPENMEEYILECNKLGHIEGEGPCNATYSTTTSRGIKMDEVRHKYGGNSVKEEFSTKWNTYFYDDDEDHETHELPPRPFQTDARKAQKADVDEDEDEDEDEDDTGNYWDENERYPPQDMIFFSKEEQPNFLVPRDLKPGHIEPLYWRDTGERIKDEEAFSIGLPPELLKEFTAYMERNGMLKVARKLIYEEERFGNDEHRLYTLDDGMKWGCMGPRWEGMDMIWIDPADEECFESLMHVLRKGGFDVVLESVGNAFGLSGLMVQGIGPIFLSHFDHDPEYNQVHWDLQDAKGSFYNVIVPLYIPEDGAPLYIGDLDRVDIIKMKYNVGTLLGAATMHGTGECDYRKKRDVRLSVAIYLADVNKDNVEIIASDSTSLWPTQGDVDWFRAQAGRVWRKDGSRSLKADKGRQPFKVEDHRKDCINLKHLCESDPARFRLECPKTCKVYLEDNEYYHKLAAMCEEPMHNLLA